MAPEKHYEGMELTVDDFRERWWPSLSATDIVQRVNTLPKSMPIIGSLYHISDGGPPCGPQRLDFTDDDFWGEVRRKIALEKQIGSEYVTFQICLPPRHMNTGGAYRNDEAYLQLCAERIARLQRICFDHGLNFYVETHIDRVSEDVEAFCKIFDYCEVYFEVNADISHYNYRGITRGSHLERILQRVGHTHQRMARTHGDLSSEVGIHFDHVGAIGDVRADWEEKGVTWQAMESMKPALRGGLSSRVVVGEIGPAFAVRDALHLDAKLVPLYKWMASYADQQAKSEKKNPF